jgi:Fe-S-cluster containining protein
MLLSAVDIRRLERKGHSREFFASSDSRGYFTLRNYGGFCVFYDAGRRCCKVHADRPLGCRFYPVIYDEAKGVVVDSICPAQSTVTEGQKLKRGKKVIKLLKKIDSEAKKRCSA